ncbi:MAG: FKBP-type peptidyl-prolyl cis-trans isomerase [Motiliproteus sp.]
MEILVIKLLKHFMAISLLGTVLLGLWGCDTELLSRLDKLESRAEVNLQAGQDFLTDNALQPNVRVTDSGLQYQVLRAGTGAIPALSDRVEVHYRGTLIDGSEFDNSYARAEPAKFPVKGLIPGWQEALQLMRVGDHWKLFIPSGLAYGKRSPSTQIPPNSTLVFEMELLAILGDR